MFFFVFAAALAPAQLQRRPPPAVASLNATQYIGRWYQVYGSASVQWTMELGGHCVTADYGAWAPRTDLVTVSNTVGVLGDWVQVNGYAVANPTGAGELDVVLGAPGHGADPAAAGTYNRTNYIIFGLGPIVDAQYDYALVSDPTGLSLYVLARNTSRYAQYYDDFVLQQLKQFGFTNALNRPRKTNQEGCTYPPARTAVR